MADSMIIADVDFNDIICRCSSTPKIASLSSHPKVVHSPGTSMIVEAKESSAEGMFET